ncbi:MAG: non-homologous end-joining DNA ligase [Alphaproteobacteria bacterium]
MPKPGRKALLEPPQSIRPQKPMAADAPPRGDGWFHEFKHDGWRLMARLDRGQVRLLTSNQLDYTAQFCLVAEELTRLPLQNAFFDGEIVAPRDDGTSSLEDFNLARSAGRERDIHYYIFDLLFLDGEDLRSLPLRQRKERLRKLLTNAPPHIRFCEHTEADGKVVQDYLQGKEIEGIVSKRASGTYKSNAHRDWLKIKFRRSQEFIIVGYSGSTQLTCLWLGYYDKGALKLAGRVRHGFTDRERRDLLPLFQQKERVEHNFSGSKKDQAGVQWIAPELVVQISYLSWNRNGVLQNARYQDVRIDKTPQDVVREIPAATEPHIPVSKNRRKVEKAPTP